MTIFGETYDPTAPPPAVEPPPPPPPSFRDDPNWIEGMRAAQAITPEEEQPHAHSTPRVAPEPAPVRRDAAKALADLTYGIPTMHWSRFRALLNTIIEEGSEKWYA